MRARAAGHDVVALDCDLLEKGAVMNAVSAASPEAVVHLAAISFVDQADEGAFYAVNVIGTLNLLDALGQLEKRPQRVLLASSANIYGNCDAGPISERQPPAPMNHYAMSKLAMEHMARAHSHQLPLVVTRPFNYTGEGQAPHFVVPKIVSHFARRAPSIELGNLHVEREFNDIDAVCSAYLSLIEHGAVGETYNICSGHAYSLRSLIDLLAEITGHHLEVNVNPAFVRRGEVHRLCGDPAKLQQLLASVGAQWHNPPLEHTLRRMLAAFTPVDE